MPIVTAMHLKHIASSARKEKEKKSFYFLFQWHVGYGFDDYFLFWLNFFFSVVDKRVKFVTDEIDDLKNKNC